MPRWESSTKPPLRNHRPSTAPQPKKSIIIEDSDSQHDYSQEFVIEAKKIPTLEKKSKSMPNVKHVVSILKSSSKVRVPSAKEEPFAIQFVESGPYADEFDLSSTSNLPQSSNDLARVESHMLTNMDSLRSVRSEPPVLDEALIEDNIVQEVEEPMEEPKEVIKPKKRKKLNRPPWGSRKANTITFELKETVQEAPKPRKPRVPVFSRRRADSSSNDSSSESEAEVEERTEEAEKLTVSEIVPSTTEPPKESEAQEDQKKSTSNPLTKLRVSQYNLFSSTAGPFRGPGDPYYKFVLGGRNIRQGAKILVKHKVAEVDQGRFDELLVDKSSNRYNTAAYNHKTLYKLRDKKKESIEKGILTKVDKLEKTRAYIITMMQSLRSHKQLLGELTEQNDQLKAEYKRVIVGINERVSQTLAKNEESVRQIKMLEHEKIAERKRLVREFARLMRHWEDERKVVEEQVEALEKAYDEKTKDLEDLMEFERASFEDPEVTTKRLLHEVETKDRHIKEMEAHIKSYGQQFIDQEKEIEAASFERGLEIIRKSMAKFTGYLDRVILKATEENLRLKKELEKQGEFRKQIEDEIHSEEQKCKVLKEALQKQVDPRRNVLRAKEFMTCTPDMDIILNTVNPIQG